MSSTAIDRRRSLAWLTAGLAAPLLWPPAAGRAGERPAGPLFLSSRGDGQGRYFVSGFARSGGARFDLALPGRGHAIARRPGRLQAVVFARRPGTFALVVDLGAGRIVQRLASGAGRHFQGHGVFSKDGRTLFSSENDFEGGRGVIGIRDATDGYRRVGEFPSHEIGPHDIGLLADGRTLVVANGGILTHPDSGRAKLNLPEMSPSLAYIDLADGALRDDHRLPAALHRLGIRHLAVGPGDEVAVALQYEGPRADLVPLVGVHCGQAEIALLSAPRGVLRRMRNYCGSVALDRDGTTLAVSCPRGNLVAFWNLADRRFLGEVAVADGCGVAATERAGEFLITGGAGGAFFYEAASRRTTAVDFKPVDRPLWDNHLTAAI